MMFCFEHKMKTRRKKKQQQQDKTKQKHNSVLIKSAYPLNISKMKTIIRINTLHSSAFKLVWNVIKMPHYNKF